ncbi:unnamed protein product [Lymnaea stagnalis]|uniref:Uncharacterized protein n=1 Tax=Lymnaea stagnalis TaxID=6523 RepID=A0AAV2HLA2_LYMST
MRLSPQLVFLWIYFWTCTSADECLFGWWGVNCENECDSGCLNRTCNSVNGKCDRGCTGPVNRTICKIGCPDGWFGSQCQFQCHCERNLSCHTLTGQCPSSSICSTGWFGSACQYQTLLVGIVGVSSTTISTTPAQPSYTWITDGNDSTCNPDYNLEALSVSWNRSFPITWLRVTLKDNDYVGLLNVSFMRENKQTATCTDQNIYVINSKTVDIRCKVIVDVVSVIIGGEGVKSLCSVYISGGRNVALKQRAEQTTTYSDAGAYRAVDGNIDGRFDQGKTCSHTSERDTSPGWNVTFGHPQVLNRVLLYNRLDMSFGIRLNKFVLQIFHSTEIVFQYQDDTDTSKSIPVFVIAVAARESTILVNGLRINVNRSDEKFVTLCEVEAFGECVPGTWGLECNNECSTICSSQCHVETGSCQVCNGFNDPPNCITTCSKGTWGLNCGNACNTSCLEISCNSITGLCDKACKGFKDFPKCSKVCDAKTWGPNCTNNCKTSCFNSSCDRLTGVCNLGCNGYSNPTNCTTACDKGKWGPNCTNTCKKSCWDNSCNHFDGTCDEGCNGYRDFPNCTLECRPGMWGLNCSRTCNSSCFNSSCDRLTGQCNKGCYGFSNPPNCTKVCDKQNWGPNCTNPCNTTCWNLSCNRFTGLCDEGCNGFKDFPNCTKECDPGESGLNCTNQCDYCYNKTCSSQTGLCNNGCDGFSNPPNCSILCNPGNWGINCTLACQSSCFDSSCDRLNGLCNNGCNGYSNPPQCTKECDKGKWGRYCLNTCNISCWDNSCNHVSGVCDQGCNGYSDFPSCTKECLRGLWGVNCTSPCNHPLQKSCNSINEKSGTSSDNIAIGVGVGLGISCAVNIALTIVIIVLMRRRKQPSITGKPAKNKDRDESYDTVGIGNEYNNDYQRPATTSRQRNSRMQVKTDDGDQREDQSDSQSSNVYNEIKHATSEYETIGV